MRDSGQKAASAPRSVCFWISQAVILSYFPGFVPFCPGNAFVSLVFPENILNTLTDEQKKKVEAAQSPEELIAIAKEYGEDLSLEQLEAVAGGREKKCRWYLPIPQE